MCWGFNNSVSLLMIFKLFCLRISTKSELFCLVLGIACLFCRSLLKLLPQLVTVFSTSSHVFHAKFDTKKVLKKLKPNLNKCSFLGESIFVFAFKNF